MSNLHLLTTASPNHLLITPVRFISLQELAGINTGTQVFNTKDCTMVENGVTKRNPNCTSGSSVSGPTVTTHTSDIS